MGLPYSRQEMPDGRWKVIREVSEGQSEEHVVHVTVDDGCDVHFRGHQLSYDVVDHGRWRSKVLAMATGGGKENQMKASSDFVKNPNANWDRNKILK